MARKRKISEERTTLDFGELRVPLRIITEAGRHNWRGSVTGKALIVRLPAAASAADRADYLRQVVDWARNLHARKPAAFDQFRQVDLADRYSFTARGETFDISVADHTLRSHRIREVNPRQLSIHLNRTSAGPRAGEVVEKLLAKFIGARHLPSVSRRVHLLNERHFQRPVRAVKLSDTYSRWGSCSTKGNINLSTRLVLAPEPVLDAVIIHELAHLVEHNHSPHFWKLVETALPDYRSYDVWLREHGKELRFLPVPLT